MGAQVTLREIVLGPTEQPIEARKIICNQRDKHSVCLTFRSRAIAGVMLDHSNLAIHKSSNIAFPQRWPVLCDTTRANQRHQRENQNRLQPHVTRRSSLTLT